MIRFTDKNKPTLKSPYPPITVLLPFLTLLVTVISCKKSTSSPPMVSTFAGNGVQIEADGTGTNASFLGPIALAIDKNNNLYVADLGNKIRKITPERVVTTIAGSGAPGSANGFGTAASFNHPSGIAVDGNGNLYIADFANNKIRKIAPNGQVTTLAGNPNNNPGSTDGMDTSASFNHPLGVAVDENGYVYVADGYNNKIRKISPAGLVSTVAGNPQNYPGPVNGPDTIASFNTPAALVIDGSNHIYVVDQGNNKIRKIAPDGSVTTLAGTGASGYADGAGLRTKFNSPYSIALDLQGNLFVSDFDNLLIREITPADSVATIAGDGRPGFVDGSPLNAKFAAPAGIVVDKNGILYVADAGNCRIRKIILN